MSFRGLPYGIPEGPWDTFGGPAPSPAWEYRITDTAPPHWPRGWVTVPDARSMLTLLDLMNDGRNYHGFEIRPVASPQLELEIA